ncbi:MAG: orotidine-5'-phosphate decarboxylase [Planctomycetota bacterium]|jgi:orotidine-5'-phosphate decarboxylase|nr:orotidine-5'-phosphate decarboxylase [Planctomycetota bacterium]
MTDPASGNFGDRLERAIREKQSVAAVGIDPTLDLLPPGLAARGASGPEDLASALREFCLGLVRAVADLVPAVKPNIAFFEAFGLPGLSVYRATCRAAAEAGLLVIGDVKRGDIGSTAAAYAAGLLDCPRLPRRSPEEAEPPPGEALLGPHDALTLNPWLGSDSVGPFLARGCGRGQGFFILVKTSNPSSSEIQNLRLAEGGTVAERTAGLVRGWGENFRGAGGLSAVGAVVGATHPAELNRFRELLPDAPFLVPGYGAQGGTAAGVVPAFRPEGGGTVISASRSVLRAWRGENRPDDWPGAARRAVLAMNAEIAAALKAAGRRGWR